MAQFDAGQDSEAHFDTTTERQPDGFVRPTGFATGRSFGAAFRERYGTPPARFRQGARRIGLELLDSETPIQPILLGDSMTALRWSEALRRQGILVTAIRPPTVPASRPRPSTSSSPPPTSPSSTNTMTTSPGHDDV